MIDKFIENLKKNHSDRTVESYIYGLKVWKDFIKDKVPNTVTKGDMVRFREWLEERRYAPKSANLIIASVRKYFTYMYERDIVEVNHALILKPFRSDTRPKSISIADFNKIFDFVKVSDYALAMFYSLMRFSGLRLSEALRVRAKDFEWVDDYAIINGVKGKGGQVTTAYFVPMISGGSKKHLFEMKEFTRSLKNVFLPKTTYGAVATLTWKISGECGIKFSCHSFRHSFAYGLLSNDVAIPNIAFFMRHKSTKVTEEIYLKMDVKLRNKYMDKVIKLTAEELSGNNNKEK